MANATSGVVRISIFKVGYRVDGEPKEPLVLLASSASEADQLLMEEVRENYGPDAVLVITLMDEIRL